MKKVFNKSELGSIMIEALAMLALIALVTPLLYKKTSERMRELQDINSASELRSIVKAVDDYISSNYDTMVAGGTITNSCKKNSQSYAGLKGANKRVEVPIGHFCEFLPYGILKDDGEARQSKLFSNYKIVLKLQGNAVEGGNNVITAFVVTDPTIDMPQLRSSSIASMIGGNGGYVTSNTGNSGTTASQGVISGNLGLWGIANTSSELGINVKKGAVVAASIQGISSQNANIDIDDVLYRRKRDDKDLNTMFTTLFMGSATADSFGQEIQNIGRLVLGQRSATGNDRLYLNSGNIRVGGDGNIQIDGTGNVSLKTGNFQTEDGKIYTKKGDIQTDKGNLKANSGALLITNSADTAISVNSNVFTVAKDGVTKALNFQTNHGEVTINVSNKTTINQPVLIKSTGGTCTYANKAGCALTVEGGEYVNGNLIVEGTFDANKLHARTQLTVGGTDPDKGPALTVDYAANASKLNFGSDLFKITQTGNKTGSLDFAASLIAADKTSATAGNFKVTVPNASGNEIGLRTGTSNLILTQNIGQLAGNSSNYLKIEGASNKTSLISPNINFNTDAFKLAGTNDTIDTLVNTVTIKPKGKDGYFRVNTTGTYGSMYADAINAYFTGKANNNRSHIYQKNSEYHMQNENGADVLKLTRSADSNAYADIYAKKVLYKNNDNSTKILEIDLKNTTPSNTNVTRDDTNYPVYIRKGVIELTDSVSDAYAIANTNKNVYNYVKADRFVSNKKTVDGDLRKTDGSALGATNYVVNPAYTSVMRDIKLTSRGGARLSDILPDFINKGIYVVDNTYPAKGETSCSGTGISLSAYKAKGLSSGKGYKDLGNIGTCTSSTQEVSPWLGFVPRPICPPGYMGVITLTPTSFAMAQAGFAAHRSEWNRGNSRSSTTDLYTINNSIRSPLDYTSEASADDAPIPFYSQKNTWLKSDAVPYPADCNNNASCKGWDLSMGFIYPYQWYKQYIWEALNTSGNYNNQDLTNAQLAVFDTQGPNLDETIIWNLFPVYAGSLEGYATVYCYFQRNPKSFSWNSSTVDTGYDQIENYKDATNLPSASKTNSNTLNAIGSEDLGHW